MVAVAASGLEQNIPNLNLNIWCIMHIFDEVEAQFFNFSEI